MADEKTPLLKSSNGSALPDVMFASHSPPTSDKGEEKPKLVPVKQLYRFMNRCDVILMIFGFIGAIGFGLLSPGQFIIMGQLTDDFVEFVQCVHSPNCTDLPDLEDSMTKIAAWYVGIGFANLLFAWMALGLTGLAAERQVHKMRLALFRNIIRQEIGWFDVHDSGELSSRLTEDLNKIAEGIGPKLGRLIYSLVAFFSSFALGFNYVWQMTLVMMAILPVMAICGALMAKVISSLTTQELGAYAKAGSVAEESFSSIRTVAAYGGEVRQTKKYEIHLEEARISGAKKGFGVGGTVGFFHFSIMCNYALSLWYGIKMVRDEDAGPGDVMSVFFMVILGSTTLGQAGPCAEAFASARAAAYIIFGLIDKESEIDPTSGEGLRPANIKGDVEFSKINFVYPSRPTIRILNNFNLKVPSGKRVALVGESGCGKSTVVKLIQRFYDPVKGDVFLDGQDIKSLNVRHLRNFIGVVNQEPVLFATTIAENISYGREGVTQREIEEAAKMANAHDFITQFPQGYNTLCGERGIQMSGGQKQRISIARALVRNPKILLLDEATSALDTESEAVVQEALDRAGEGRTTILIAHRLSTVRNADMIVAVKDGQVAETGTHDELMRLGGVYKTLVRLQKAYDADDEKNQVGEDEDNMVASFEVDQDGAFKLGSFSTSGSHVSKVAQTEVDDTLKDVSFWHLLKMNAKEWKFILTGCIGSGLYGSTPFLYGVLMGGMFEALSGNPKIAEDREDMKDDSEKYAVYFVLMGFGTGLGLFVQYWMFSKSGEYLTKKLRSSAFSAYLRQDIAYFDNPKNSTGAICTRLASEVSSVQGATGSQLGYVTSCFVSIVGCLVVSFINTWRLSLVLVAFSPLTILAGLFYMSMLGGGSRNIGEEAAGKICEETFSNIQTVASLGREEEFFERYRSAMIKPYKEAKRAVHFSGLTTGSTMCIISFSFAAAFRYGGKLISDGDITLKEMMTSIYTILAGAIIVGNTSSLAPDYTSAKLAARKLFTLLDMIPTIDSQTEGGLKPEACSGEIQLVNTRFVYPSRRAVKVLRNLNITVKPGQTVALVGTSGCGKSTSVSLIERFYDTNSGKVLLDGNDIKVVNVKWLRNQIGLVSQEPVLFDQTIRENIAYGNPGNVTDSEIQEAAKAANIHEFIASLPLGYDTKVGDKGTLISGGQKQRIAIARALIRDPKILLLDEATSALDTESEKVVQQALDNASIGRTTLVIAHRLSTIQHADSICVIRKGRVVERGTHQQLLAMKGIYHALHKVQATKKDEQ